MTVELPTFVTHYHRGVPFRSLTDLDEVERAAVIAVLDFPPGASHRFHSPFYFEQRQRYEATMYRQFVAKGGVPQRQRPHYAILGESEIWEAITTHSVRIPLSNIRPDQISFTYTDSWFTYVEREADGTVHRQKRAYGQVFRLDELSDVFTKHGWPGERWKTETEWANDIYVEAQLWVDDSNLECVGKSSKVMGE